MRAQAPLVDMTVASICFWSRCLHAGASALSRHDGGSLKMRDEFGGEAAKLIPQITPHNVVMLSGAL